MKHNIIYLLFTLFACAFMACNDDFFDQVPNDRLTIEQVFERREYSQKYLATIYSYIRDESHRTNDVPWDPCSDDLDVTYDRGVSYPSFLINLGKWSASSGYYNYWAHYYNGIRSATYFMQHIGGNREMVANGEEKLIAQYRDEARFLRAWFYYCLLRQYGPMVIIGDDVIAGDLDKDDIKMNLPRTPYDDCVQYIVNELDALVASDAMAMHFDVQEENDYGRATKAMCLALKSRLLLLAASPQFNGNSNYVGVNNPDGTPLFNTTYDKTKWEKAAKAAKDVIDLGIFDLYKVYNSNNMLNPYLSCRNVLLEPWNKEVIMVRMSNGLQYWERSASPRQFSGYESMGITQQLVDAFRMNNGKPITDGSYVEDGYSTTAYKDGITNWVFAPAGVRNMYVNREPRFYVNVAFNGSFWIGDQTTQIQLYFSGGSGKKGSWDFPRTGYIAIKNVSPSSNPRTNTYIKRPFVIMRYAEILLNYVEALNEYDPGNPDVELYLNMIRNRGGIPDVETGLNQELMREQIRVERRVELCLEQLRYFDTRRWLIAEQTDGGAFWGMDMDAGNGFKDDAFYKRTVFETRVFRKEFYLFPIPQSEIDRDKQIVQNPGW